MDKHPIDKLFKTKLSHTPITPSPKAWAKLEEKFESKPFLRRRWVLGTGRIAACILLLWAFWWAFYPPSLAVRPDSPYVKAGKQDKHSLKLLLDQSREPKLSRSHTSTKIDMEVDVQSKPEKFPDQRLTGQERNLSRPKLRQDLVVDTLNLPDILRDTSQKRTPDFVLDPTMLAQENQETQPDSRQNYTITVKIKLGKQAGLDPSGLPKSRSQGVLAKILKPNAEKAKKRKLLSEKILASLGK